MTLVGENKFSPNSNVEYKSKQYTVVNTYCGSVTLKDDSGKMITISQKDLRQNSIYSFNQAMLEQNAEHRQKLLAQNEEYKKEDATCQEKIKEIRAKIEGFYSECKTRFTTNFTNDQKKSYKDLTDELYACNSKHTSLSNREYGIYQSLFCLALNDGKWKNMA